MNMQNLPLDRKTEDSEYLKSLLADAVRAKPADALLLSGGIDSSMLAALDPDIPAITVGLDGKSMDLGRAQKVTEHLGMRWHPIVLSREEAAGKIREIIRLTNSYDPAVLNDIPTFTGMTYARRHLGPRVRNGEFADTLFAGYSYLQHVDDFRKYLADLIPNVILSTTRIGDALGLHTLHPYLERKVVEFAKNTDPRQHIAQVQTTVAGDQAELMDGTSADRQTQRWTKILLRRSALGLLPIDIVYRPKSDLEFGSGMNDLSDDIASQIGDEDLETLGKEKKFWNRMHARLFQMFQEMNLEIRPPSNDSEYACTWCGAGVTKGRCHCLTCGAYKANE